jgi:hypothetical protein
MSRTSLKAPQNSDALRRNFQRILAFAHAIDELRAYQLDPTVDFPRAAVSPFLGDEEMKFLSQDGGRSFVATWLAAFARSIAILLDFRDQLVSGTAKADMDDLHDVEKSASSMFSALQQRIRMTLRAA